MALATIANAPSVIQKATTKAADEGPNDVVTFTEEIPVVLTLKDKKHWTGLDPIFPDCWSLSQLVASRKEDDDAGNSRGLLITAQSKVGEFNLHIYYGDKASPEVSVTACELKGKPKLHITRDGKGAVFMTVRAKMSAEIALELHKHVGKDTRISLDFKQLALPGTVTDMADAKAAKVKGKDKAAEG